MKDRSVSGSIMREVIIYNENNTKTYKDDEEEKLEIEALEEYVLEDR